MKVLIISSPVFSQALVDKINKIAAKSDIHLGFVVSQVVVEPFTGLKIPIHYYGSATEAENLHPLPAGISSVHGLTIATGQGDAYLPVDLLISASWPSKISIGSSIGKSIKNIGVDAIAQIAASLEPQYHFAAGAAYFEREPYRNINASHCTRFIGLADFGNKTKEKWFYALNINPLSSTTPVPPPNATSCPYITPKINSETDHNFFFGGQNQQRPTQIKNKRKAALDADMDLMCRSCGERGHSARLCPDAPRQNINALRLKKRDCKFPLTQLNNAGSVSVTLL